MGHGTIKYCAKTSEGKALESPFSRLFLKEEHHYHAHAISLLAGALGPMQENESEQPSKPSLRAGFTFLGQFIDHDLTEFRVVDEEMRLIEKNPTLGVRQRVAPVVQKIYRQIVLCDYLPRIVQQDIINRVKASLEEGTSFYQKMNRNVNQGLETPESVVAMPVEFAHAAFRLGHSQLINGYQLNANNALPLFNTLETVGSQAGDLRGNQAITAATEITWSYFFGASAQYGAPLDTTLPSSLFRLPQPAVTEPPISLAERNILRAIDFGVPSGQEVAVALRQNQNYGSIPLVAGNDLAIPSEVLAIEPSLEVLTPLWYYILREAEILNPNSSELGPVGGYIVAETLLGSLLASGFDINAHCPETPDDSPETITEPTQINSMVDLLGYLGEL